MNTILNKSNGVGILIIGIGVAMLQGTDTPWYAGTVVIALGAAVMALRHAISKQTPGVPTAPPPVLPLIVACVLVAGCTTTNYNIDFHNGAFRVADKMKIDPGQGGDDGSSTAGAPTSGGEEGSPGGSNVLDGFAQQGNIFQIGTAAKSDGDARASAVVQSPNSTSGTGEDVVVNEPGVITE